MQDQEVREVQETVRRLESQVRDVLKAYAQGIEATSQHALRSCPPLEKVYRQPMTQLGLALIGEMPPGLLETHVANLAELLQRFGDEAQRDYEAKGDEIRELLRLLASATDSLAFQSSSGSEQLNSFAAEIERIADAGSLSEMRRRLRQQVREMRTALDGIQRSSTAKLSALEREVAGMRARLAAVESASGLDELTHVSSRQEIERHATSRISNNQIFCVLLFNIRRFRVINETYGRDAGDMVLREFASRLRAGIRPSDIVGRWQNDEFVILLDCGLRDAMVRARQVYERACTRYRINASNRDLRLDVSASLGVAESRPQETWEKLLDRVNQMLAAAKASDPPPPVASLS